MRTLREGIWHYAGASPVGVRIDVVDLRPGSGDHEDPPEYREDLRGTFFHVAYTPAGERRFANGGGYFLSLDDAVRAAETMFVGIVWRAPGT